MSPSTVKAGLTAVKWAQTIAGVSQAGQIATAAAKGVNAAVLATIDVLVTREARTHGQVKALVTTIMKDIQQKAKETYGVVIWIHVTWQECKWERCWYKPWMGANAWQAGGEKGKGKWHRCSAESPAAPLYGSVAGKDGAKKSAGFEYDDLTGIPNALPGCFKEAIGSVK